MPPRADPGHRDAIEVALSPVQLQALREGCADRGIPVSAWPAVPMLYRAWASLAAARLAARFESKGLTRERAVNIAALRLGIPEKTIHSWNRRTQKDAATVSPHSAVERTEGGSNLSDHDDDAAA